MRRRRRPWLSWEIAATVAVVAIVVAVLVVIDRDGELAPAAPPAPSTGPTTGPFARSGPLLAVKIDNVPAARPQTGLGSADVVYVEPVEGGLTRLVALYYGDPPEVVGPVRSARRTDIELLAQYERPMLAYSGAAPELLPSLRAAELVNASPAEAAAAYFRERDRPEPHNLYLRPARLPDGDTTAPAVEPLEHGVAPRHTGVPATDYRVTYSAAAFGFTWLPGDRAWTVAMNGTPVVSTESGRITAGTVVEQRVVVTAQEPIEDAHGTVSPVARTVGSGEAVVLRDGLRFTGAWSRATAQAPTRYRTPDGRALPLGAGPVWVLLVPA